LVDLARVGLVDSDEEVGEWYVPDDAVGEGDAWA
jgi:hypothetical protein